MHRQWRLLVFASIALSGRACLMAGEGMTTRAGKAVRATCPLVSGPVVASHRQLAHPIPTTVWPARIQQIQFEAFPDDLPVPPGYQAVDVPLSTTKLWNVDPERGHSLRAMQVDALHELYHRPVASASPDRAIVPRGSPDMNGLSVAGGRNKRTVPPPVAAGKGTSSSDSSADRLVAAKLVGRLATAGSRESQGCGTIRVQPA